MFVIESGVTVMRDECIPVYKYEIGGKRKFDR